MRLRPFPFVLFLLTACATHRLIMPAEPSAPPRHVTSHSPKAAHTSGAEVAPRPASNETPPAPTPPHSHIAFSPTKGWTQIPNDGRPFAATVVHDRTGAVIRAFIVRLDGRAPRDLAKRQFVELMNTGHRVVTTSCCAIDSAIAYAWSASVPLMQKSPVKKKRGKKNSHSGDDGTGRRGIISVRTIEKDEAHAVVIVGSWAETDHHSLQKDVTAAVAGLHLE